LRAAGEQGAAGAGAVAVALARPPGGGAAAERRSGLRTTPIFVRGYSITTLPVRTIAHSRRLADPLHPGRPGMHLPPPRRAAQPLLVLAVLGAPALADELPKSVPSPEELQAGYQRGQRGGPPRARAYKDRIAPNWFRGDSRFWYRNDLRGGAKE